MTFQLRWPSRLTLGLTVGGPLILLAAECLTGTDHLFAELIFVFLLLAGLTVHALGGLQSVAGVAVAVLTVRCVLFSQVVKIILCQPAELNLERPHATAGVMALGMAALLIAALLVRLIPSGKPLLQSPTDPATLRKTALILIVMGVVAGLGTAVVGASDDGGLRVGGIAGPLRQFSWILGLAVVASTACVLTESQGRRCFGWLNLFPIALASGIGFITGTKQQMFEPLLFVAMTACAFRLKLRPAHLGAAAVAAAVVVIALYPFAQQARKTLRLLSPSQSFIECGRLLSFYFGSVEGFRTLHAQDAELDAENQEYSYFGNVPLVVDRLSLIKMADILVAETYRSGHTGWETVVNGFQMVVPRFLYPRKPVHGTGGFLGQRTGVIAEDDDITQITFPFMADAFGAFGWVGVLTIPLLLGMAFFLVYRFLAPPIDQSIWSVYLMAQFQHEFTESHISALIQQTLVRSLLYMAVYLAVRQGVKLWNIHEAAGARTVRRESEPGMPASGLSPNANNLQLAPRP